MITIIDTDALLALVNPNDALHARAKHLAQEFSEQQYTLYILPTTLCEFAMIATIRIGFEPAKRAPERITEQAFFRLDVPPSMVASALTLFQKQTSKENSLVDCFNVIASREQSVDCIFSFDKGYKQNGLTLAEEYFQRVQ